MSGTVYLVGAGPGDPELLTVKARRLIEAADVVVHDRLVGAGVLALIPATCRRVAVGKEGGGPSVAQAHIEELLVRFAREGRSVVRLKGGDPFVFGRGGEEVEALRAARIAVEVVPGVSAGVAAPALAGIPVTYRGLARTVAFVAGEEGAGVTGPPVDWAALAGVDTLVVFMARRSARSTARSLLEAGREAALPVAVIVDASLPSQQVWVTDLGRLTEHGVDEAADGRPTLLVIGSVAGLAAEGT